MNKINSFQDLIAWQECHQLVISIYTITKRFPSEEKFGLTSQMRRAAVSVTSNIAEGFGRTTRADRYRFYVIAQGSLVELQNQIIISKDTRIISSDDYQKLYNRSVVCLKILRGLMRSTRTNNL